MESRLKERILDLLKKDREFRYAVAGLIGLEEVLRRFDKYDEKFAEIIEILREHTARFEEYDKKFIDIIARLEEHDRKFNLIFDEIKSIRYELAEVKVYMERTSLTLEEEAWEVLSAKLRKMGVDVKLSRLVLPDMEVNIYGLTDDLCVIGEVSVRAGIRVIDSIGEKIDELKRRYPGYLRSRILKVVYTMWATDDAVEEARKNDVWLLRVTDDLTTPVI